MSVQDEGGQADHGGQETGENLFALSFPKGEESFPVLKAFQEFLDAERERARRRQMTLAICFMSALVVLVVMFCVVGAVIFSGMIRRNDAQQARMLDLLLQRTAVTADAKKSDVTAPEPVRQDPALTELIEMVRQLKAENAAIASRNASADRQVSAVTPPPAVESAQTGKGLLANPAAPVKKTGVFSSPKRQPEPVPQATRAGAQSSAVGSGGNEAGAADGDAGAWKTVQVKVVPSREMHVPDGYAAEEMSVVSDKNVRMPLRVLMPTGADAKAVTP